MWYVNTINMLSGWMIQVGSPSETADSYANISLHINLIEKELSWMIPTSTPSDHGQLPPTPTTPTDVPIHPNTSSNSPSKLPATPPSPTSIAQRLPTALTTPTTNPTTISPPSPVQPQQSGQEVPPQSLAHADPESPPIIL